MRAAQYVRVSTDLQQYSIVNQQAAIAEYAALHNFEIVKTYADAARSGLDIKHPMGLQSLIDVATVKGRPQRAISVLLPIGSAGFP